MLFLSLFKTLQGCKVEVELKNGFVFTGLLDTVDQYHNLKLKNIKANEPEKFPQLASVSELFIRGSVVRYISIPEDRVDFPLLHEATRRANPLVKAGK